MKKHLTHTEAWKDFWDNRNSLPNWNDKSFEERGPAYVANRAYRKGGLGPVRVQRMLQLYAPERYNFELVITINEETK